MRNLYRKLQDQKGNLYALEIPGDVGADDLTDILTASNEGLVTLRGYKLVEEDVYRTPADNQEIPNSKKAFTFYSTIKVPLERMKDFRETMQALIEKAKGSYINKPKVTTWKGSPILFDERGAYVEAQVPCDVCDIKIEGVKRLSVGPDGSYSREQAFTAFDKRVTQLRPGSPRKVCGACSPVHLKPRDIGLDVPTVEEVVKQEKIEERKLAIEAKQEEVKALVRAKKQTIEDELLDLAKPGSDVDPVFLKGALYFYLKSQK